MRTITTSVDVYPFDELSVDAQAHALDALRERECSRSWNNDDIDETETLMVYTLAGKFKSPGWDTHGEADFPGSRRCSFTGGTWTGASTWSWAASWTRATPPGCRGWT